MKNKKKIAVKLFHQTGLFTTTGVSWYVFSSCFQFGRFVKTYGPCTLFHVLFFTFRVRQEKSTVDPQYSSISGSKRIVELVVVY